MKMNQLGKGLDTFQTPKFLFNELNERFSFTVDAACCTYNSHLENGFFYDQDINGLEQSWAGHRVFCNPPFSEKGKWIEKAHKEVTLNNCPLVVMILPTNSMDSKPWHDYVYKNYHYEILQGRVSFINPETGKPGSGNNSGTTIIYFWKLPLAKQGQSI